MVSNRMFCICLTIIYWFIVLLSWLIDCVDALCRVTYLVHLHPTCRNVPGMGYFNPYWINQAHCPRNLHNINISCFSWFWRHVSRGEAEKLLTGKGTQAGAFCVRRSESVQGLKNNIFIPSFIYTFWHFFWNISHPLVWMYVECGLLFRSRSSRITR